MKEDTPIVNRVASSPLITFDLETYYHQGERVLFDIKDFLFEEMILREKDFRVKIKEFNWEQFDGKNIAVFCSVDAIIPSWAWMLIMTQLSPFASMVVQGDLPALEMALFQQALGSVNVEEYRDKKVVVKGCGKYPVPDSAYLEITRLFTPVVSSLIYGEPCSTVPLYKRPVQAKEQK